MLARVTTISRPDSTRAFSTKTCAEGFEAGLRRAKRFVEARAGGYAEITINAWNEWTEGSYLLPDVVNGTRMLEAVRHVFGPRDTRIR